MLERIIAEGAAALGIALPEDAPERMRRYYLKLTEANRQFNLTSIEGEDDVARLHFLDSVAALRYADFSGKSVIDVGTGGGLPGLALKIAEPSMDMTLLDATEKKVEFLRELTASLGVPCRCVAGRAEELGREGAYRESRDIAVARAVAELRVLAELCLPLVRVGGELVALKSTRSDEELDAAAPAIEALGGALAEVRDYTLPGTDIPRRIVTVKKIAPTPERFPRRYAAIRKKAL